MQFIKRHYGIILVLLILGAGRCMLIRSGLLDDTDELPFLEMLRQSELLWSGNADAWNKQVIGLWSTYPETAIRLFQSVFLNAYAHWKDIDPITNDALMAIGVFNVLTSLLIALLFYLILQRIGFEKGTALIGVLLYGTLLNSNLYVRHILPYDTSLLFHLIAVFLMLKGSPYSTGRILTAGFFCGLGYFTYHGNFTFLFITWVILVFQIPKNWKSCITSTFLIAMPSVLMFALLECLSRQSGKGFLEHTIFFSGTIFHGSPEETLLYVFKYFFLVEKSWGIFVLAMCFAGVNWVVWQPERFSSKLKLFLFVGLATYCLFGIFAQITGYMVFYGRVFHMYYPFIVVGALAFVAQVSKIRVPLALLAAINFIFMIKELNAIGYPRSMVFEFNLFDNTHKTSFDNELHTAILYNHQLRYFHELDWDLATYRLPQPKEYNVPRDSLILLNFAFFYHYPDDFMNTYRRFTPPEDAVLLTERLHFMSHPAYTFEYCTIAGRRFFLKKKIHVSIYSKPDTP